MSLPRLLLPLLVLAACTLPPFAPPAAAQHPQDPARSAEALAEALDEHAPRWLDEHDVPSLAAAYIRDGAVAWIRVYGEQADGVPATPQTLYNVASLAKPVFAETMLRLTAAGRITLDEPLAAHWVDPDVATDPRHERLTPRIALSHRTGFKNWRYQTEGVLRFEFEPGTALGYSGEGYEYAKRFVEEKLGASFASLAGRYVFEPLGMTQTAHTRQDGFEGRVALPYGPDGAYLEPSFQDTASAADDLYTTVGDYAAFLVGVMNRDGLPDAYAAQRDSIHAVDEEATAECDPARVAHCPVRIGMGLGWEIIAFPDETARLHTGSDRGESTMAFYLAERREGAVLFTNGAAGFAVMFKAVDLLVHDSDFAALARSR